MPPVFYLNVSLFPCTNLNVDSGADVHPLAARLQAGDAVQELPNIALSSPSHVSLKVSLLQIMIRITDSEICTEPDQYPVSVYTIRRLLAIESSWKVWLQHG